MKFYEIDRKTAESLGSDEKANRIIIRRLGRKIGTSIVAGPYCFDCSATFCKGGPEAIHTHAAEWMKACPSCGAVEPKTPLDEANGPVKWVYSFSWHIASCNKNKTTVDEKGKVYSSTELGEYIDEHCVFTFNHQGTAI